jgi:glutaconyl-CoA/methylmalonyl-CoA decarboxylase subunit delta
MDTETLKLALGGIAAAVILWLAVKQVARFLGWVQKSEIARQAEEAAEAAERKRARAKAAAAPAVAPKGIPPHHVAAIAAAVAACGYRVAHIADPHTGGAWAAEGRWLQQTSHNPH